MKKGFTLIELLAVIVILAIIALIATPVVLNIVKNSKISANKRSSEGYLNAVKQSLSSKQFNSTIKNGVYYVNSDGNLIKVDDENEKIKVDVNGLIPKYGSFYIYNNNIIQTDVVENYTAPKALLNDSNITYISNTHANNYYNSENKLGFFRMYSESEKYYDETINKNMVKVKILFDVNKDGTQYSENGAMFMITMGSLYFDGSKFNYESYTPENSVRRDYMVNLLDDNTLVFNGAEIKDRVATETSPRYATLLFSTDLSLESIDISNFALYVVFSDWFEKNIVVTQSLDSEFKIINGYNKIMADYYKVENIDKSRGYTPGDINNDGYIDLFDLIILRKGMLGSIDCKCKAADVTGDGVVDILDMIRLKKYLNSLDTVLEYSTMTDVPDHL